MLIAARRVIRAFFDWGVLAETTPTGAYRQAAVHAVDDPPLVLWLLTAALISEGGKNQELAGLVNWPSLFPFVIASPTLRTLQGCEWLEVYQDAQNMPVVALREQESPGQGGTVGRRRSRLSRQCVGPG